VESLPTFLFLYVLDVFSPANAVWSAPCSSLIGVDRKSDFDGPPIVVGIGK
jgi:hypothetical protein